MLNPILWQFPESLWPPINPEEYLERIRAGYDIMRGSTVTICGLARNIGNKVGYLHGRLNYLCHLFNSVNICIYTNDNEDDTLSNLQSMQARFNYDGVKFNLIAETLYKEFHGSVTTQERYRDMAYYRNKYLEYLRYETTSKHLIVIDTDIIGGFSWDGLAHSFSYIDSSMGCIGSNSLIYENRESGPIRLYYDALAFRRLNSTKPHNQSEINLLCYNRNETLLEVQSAFGGLAIYNVEPIRKFNLTYDESDCDHVTLNKKLVELGYRNYMNPAQIVLYSDSLYSRTL